MTASTQSDSDVVGRRPPFDPELALVLEAMGPQSTPSGPQEIAAYRQVIVTNFGATDDELRCGGRMGIETRTVPGPDGQPDISLLICRPVGVPGPLPVIFHIHGGGMIYGDARMGLPEILEWACRIPMVVVSPEYRLAPEHPHPAPVEDCYAGLVWTAEHSSELGTDSSRLIVEGGSAGGGLSAATVLLAHDRGGPAVCAQMLICPMIDDRNDTVSARQMAGVGVFDRASNEAGWTALLGDRRGGNDVSPYAAPARATDLSGLPPTFIDVGSAETFRDEAVTYASGIWAAGGNCELHVWAGGFHGFHSIAPDAAVSKATLHARFEWLARTLGHLS